ncbi:hypothetical protein FXN63_00675 [Pigmentiphaga aceris]|uniref:Uncharacterized protein n=1 Tax=Pigmentiphaga aceris TaxID=1940612 RepID=A0A5C0AW02_9BURK|nr:hypothetical protein [Pigmentiphaga aceris]QEI04507.1 hypothetical protein FXN63_00675 [Pigmentiphaga aceris]
MGKQLAERVGAGALDKVANAARVRWVSAAALLACVSVGIGVAHADPSVVKSAPADAAFFASASFKPPAGLVEARQVLDISGRHILTLTRIEGPSREMPDPKRNERFDLLVTYYEETPTGWQPAWTIKDGVDCPGLDGAAQFLSKGVTVTDLDRNGMAEVTVPYATFCGGGVDPAVLKVILRQGETKLALRGETELQFPGQPSMGGKNTPDKALLLPENAVFKRHLDKVWQQVKVVELW